MVDLTAINLGYTDIIYIYIYITNRHRSVCVNDVSSSIDSPNIENIIAQKPMKTI